MMKFRTGLYILGGLLLLIGILSLFKPDQFSYDDTFQLFSGGLFLIAIAAAIQITGKWIKTRCPACKRNWALQKVNVRVLNKEQYSAIVQLDSRDRKGDYIGTREEIAPGIRTTYEIVYKCKYCGYTKTRTYVEERENIVRR